MTDLLEKLNPAQREAVMHPGGPLLIIAGAGSGKTRVITHRIAWLIREQGLDPQALFAATFTNKAAQEMRERVEQLLGRGRLGIPIATFHSLCARSLRQEAHHVGRTERFAILDEADQKGLLKEIIKSLGLRPEDCPPSQAQHLINRAKMKLQTPKEFSEDLPRMEDEWVADVYDRYERRLRESDAFDFEDLIGEMVRLLEKNEERREHYQRRFKHVLVDEYQDTNHVQYRLVRLLSGAHGNLCVVGDEDQSIYSWRGADIDNVLSFQRDFEDATVIKLEQNYRSSGNILKAASAVIENNSERLGKTLWTEAPDGEMIDVIQAPNEHAEAQHVVNLILSHRRNGRSLSDIAIFYRVNALSRIFEEKLLEEAVPYRVFGGVRFFERKEIKDLMAYLDLIENPNNAVALHRVINTPRRGIGAKTVQRIVETADHHEVSLWKGLGAMLERGDIRGKAAKGLADFALQVEGWRADLPSKGLAATLQQMIDDIEYSDFLRRSDPLSASGREENCDELVRSLAEFEERRPDATLSDYLEKVALESAADEYDPGEDSVSLMTLHTAKGLEFDIVHLVGMEEPIFPSRRAVEEGRGLEEERRLFYVGLTRARKKVTLSHSQSRFLHGQVQWTAPSSFLSELPPEIIDGALPMPRSPRFTPQATPFPTQKAFAPEEVERPESAQVHRTGQRVRHSVFGEGKILGVRGEGAMRRLVIGFEGNQLIELMEQYADLTVVPDGGL